MVTVLFADLVGFTSRAERMDPEDVRALLAPYYARLRAELERFGGTVEKFIGDAVMALFGAPVAHEDDPERAVRAALAIRDWIASRSDGCRCGSRSRPARRSSRSARGRARARGWRPATSSTRPRACSRPRRRTGSSSTRRPTARPRQAIEYREARPVQAKGKAEPVSVWEALEPRSRFGVDVARRRGAPLVGRAQELDVLPTRSRAPRASARRSSSRSSASPGSARAGSSTSSCSGGRGRSGAHLLAAGPVAPVRRGRHVLGARRDGQGAGRDPRDRRAPRRPRRSSRGRGATSIAGRARRGLGRRGTCGRSSGSADDAESAATGATRRSRPGGASSRRSPSAARSCSCSRTCTGRTTACSTSSTTSSSGRAACRCSSSARRGRSCSSAAPAGAAASANATTISLSPLSRRRHGAADRRAPRAAAARRRTTQAALLARAGGNPLYAEEYVRMLAERGAGDEELPLPETVQGIIAARLDTLSPRGEGAAPGRGRHRQGVLARRARRASAAADAAIDERLHALERKEFVRRERRSSVGGETEYAFRHVLVRDVAYGQIPRARARREARPPPSGSSRSAGARGPRRDARAPLPRGARARARPSGQGPDLSWRARTRGAPRRRRAGAELERPLPRRGSSRRALELWPDGRCRPGRADGAGNRGAWQPTGASRSAQAAETRVSCWSAAEDELAAECGAPAREHVLVPGQPRRFVAASRSRPAMLAEASRPLTRRHSRPRAGLAVLHALGRNEPAIESGRDALAMAEKLGVPAEQATALNNIGTARANSRRLAGVQVLERAIQIAALEERPRARSSPHQSGGHHGRLG